MYIMPRDDYVCVRVYIYIYNTIQYTMYNMHMYVCTYVCIKSFIGIVSIKYP